MIVSAAMPIIVIATLGFAPGLLAGLLLGWSPWTLAPLAAIGAWFAARGAGAPSSILHPLSSVVFTAAAGGILWGAGARRVRAADCRLAWRDGAKLSIVAEPRDLAAEDDPSGLRRYDILKPAACAGPIMVRLPHPGTSDRVLVLVGTWRRDPGFRDALLPARPVRAGKLLALVARPVGDAPGLRTRLRTGAERRLRALFGSRRWPLAAALTVSPEAAIPKAMRQQFARAGLSHILSISGLHVGLLAGALIIALQTCRIPTVPARLLGTVLVIAYIWMLGFPAPALRSAGLLVLWCWARVRQRPPFTAAILATTALVVLAFDPWTLFEPGPWLSFAGVWGCAAAARWWERVVSETRSRRGRRRLRWLAPVVVSCGAVLATTPIQLLAFGSVTPVAVLANLAAIPIAAFATPALALVLVLAIIPGAGAAAALAASASGIALDALEAVASQAAAVPWATFLVDEPMLPACLCACAALWLLRPGTGRRPARVVLGTRLCAAVLAMAAAAAWRPLRGAAQSSEGDGQLTLHFLSVGQGDAEAIRTPHGHWILIDAGPRVPGMDAGARRVVPFLRRHGVRRLDLVVSTHGDADHLGGLPAVLASLPAAVAIEPGAVDARPLYLEWLADVARDGVRWHPARAGEHFDLDGVTVRIWHPDSATIAARWEPNEYSVVLTVEYGAFRAAFTGDAGLPMEALRAGQVGRVTLLKVAHHGSRSATGEAWLDALRPAVCVIEVGTDNHYGHPDPGTVARLLDRGCSLWRTDRDGDVTVTTDGRAVRVRPSSGRDTAFALASSVP